MPHFHCFVSIFWFVVHNSMAVLPWLLFCFFFFFYYMGSCYDVNIQVLQKQFVLHEIRANWHYYGIIEGPFGLGLGITLVSSCCDRNSCEYVSHRYAPSFSSRCSPITKKHSFCFVCLLWIFIPCFLVAPVLSCTDEVKLWWWIMQVTDCQIML